MKCWTPVELARYARTHSPFYRDLYREWDGETWEQLPIVVQDEFWRAGSAAENQLLTESANGILFRSGGTTGNPKFSLFSMPEWEAFTSEFARGMDLGELSSGDRVANLFYAGDLYASFLFINKSLEKLQHKIISLPIAGHVDLANIDLALRDYGANAICGVPTTLLNLRAVATAPYEQIEKILYGGESLFEDQLERLKELFPNAIFTSIGYASVDGGHLGFHRRGEPRQLHHVFKPTSLMEIVDEESGEIITESGKSGRLVYTNLIRSMMPIIRYPVGDSAMWAENGVGESFLLQGRTDEGARVGPVTFNRDDFLSVLARLDLQQQLLGFQFEIDREDALDRLNIRVAFKEGTSVTSSQLLEVMLLERAMLKKSIAQKIVATPRIFIQSLESLAVNPRTGKLKLVLDKRFN